ncbi:F-box protein DOR [Cardamine amara subsp. amara]|uniref:F-box protein DOR n=1 Tax=Cardamine amara subsp. amara TaxID=228776 RepID=A0ABD1ALW4_CARAN
MKKHLRHVFKKKKVCKALSKRNTRSSSSRSMTNSELIPVDLIIEILSRLPAKSISRFRCVSKEWASILHRQYFTNLFLKMSSSRPRLLFIFRTDDDKLFFLSAHQPLNPDQNSSPLVVDYHMSFSTKTCSPFHMAPVFGLVCSKPIKVFLGIVYRNVNTMIYNPSTGQSIPLPRIQSMVNTRTVLGYDPINKQYKVLCMKDRINPLYTVQILTLGTGTLSWKTIGCSLLHFPVCGWICINGVLYYPGDMGNTFPKRYTIVCFDVRFEKFKFVEPPDNIDVTWLSTMINYTGKLGIVLVDDFTAGFTRKTTSLELWVLDDVVKNKWSQHIYVFPPMWKNLVADSILYIAGMTSNGEIVFSSRYLIYPFYIFFYNFAKNSIVRVPIQGFESIHIKRQYIHTYIDHIEDVKQM